MPRSRPTETIEQAEVKYRKLADKVVAMRDAMEARVSAGETAFSIEQWGEWEAVNRDLDTAWAELQELRRVPDSARRAAEKIYRQTHSSQRDLDDMPSTFSTARSDRQSQAIRCWARSQSGLPVSDSDREAARELGISPDSRDLVLDLLPAAEFAEFRDAHLEKRVLSGGGSTSGATLRPEGFIPMLEKKMLAYGSVMQACRLLQTDTGNLLPWPTGDDTGNTGEQLADDNTAVGGADPVFGSVIFGAWPFSSKLVRVPNALLEDSGVDLAAELGGMLGERLGRILNSKFTTGADTTEPHGIVPGATVGKTATGAAAIADVELIDLQHSVDSSYRQGASWMMNDSTLAYIRKLKDLDGRFLWSAGDGGLSSGPGGVLLGSPVWVNHQMPNATAGLRPILYGDMSSYVVRRVRQIRLRRLVERYAEFDQEGFVAFIRADGRLLQPAGIRALQMAAE